MKVTAILRKDQPDKDGLCKIVIRINDREKKRYIATQFKVKPFQFQKGKVVKHEKAAFLNGEIAKEIERVSVGSISFKPVTFQSFCEAFIAEHTRLKTRKPTTLRYYKEQLEKFTSCAGDLPLHKITPEVIKAYQGKMNAIGNHHNTIWKGLKFIKTILNAAKHADQIASTPFEKMEKLKYKKPLRRFLPAADVGKIAALVFEPGAMLFNVRNWFLFQCYTGIRAGDLKQVDKDKILNEGRIILSMEKTMEVTSLNLSAEVKKLLEQWAPFTVTLEDYNRQLKLLAAHAGIKTNLSSHVARHSFGMRFLEVGGSIEVLQKIYGHADIRTTQIYAEIQNKRIDKEMEGFGF